MKPTKYAIFSAGHNFKSILLFETLLNLYVNIIRIAPLQHKKKQFLKTKHKISSTKQVKYLVYKFGITLQPWIINITEIL